MTEFYFKKVDIDKDFVEVELPDKDAFLKIKETLTRIGIANVQEKKLFQSCYILHKRGRYFITHFKELLMLDGRPTNFDESDLARRNTIANLLEQWNLLEVSNKDVIKEPVASMSNIFVLPFKKKEEWELVSKYPIGGKKKEDEEVTD